MILVKVAVVGTRTEEVSLEDNATVADALRAASKSAENLDIRIDGKAASLTTRLSDGDVIHLVAKTKGGR